MKCLRAPVLAFVVLVAYGAAWGDEFVGRIVGVIDGDTIEFLTDAKVLMRVRLSGIDAPERSQAFGSVAKVALSDLSFDRKAIISGKKRDRWGRLVGKVVVDGADMNLQMIRRGLAWHYKKYQREQPVEDRNRYAEAELKAKAQRIGLWVNQGAVPPWEFRASKKRPAALLPYQTDSRTPLASLPQALEPAGWHSR